MRIFVLFPTRQHNVCCLQGMANGIVTVDNGSNFQFRFQYVFEQIKASRMSLVSPNYIETYYCLKIRESLLLRKHFLISKFEGSNNFAFSCLVSQNRTDSNWEAESDPQ